MHASIYMIMAVISNMIVANSIIRTAILEYSIMMSHSSVAGGAGGSGPTSEISINAPTQ